MAHDHIQEFVDGTVFDAQSAIGEGLAKGKIENAGATARSAERSWKTSLMGRPDSSP